MQQQALSLGEPSLLAVLKKTALHSKADGNVVNYTYNIIRWVEFARFKGLNVFPASVIDVSLFIAYLSATYKSSSVIQSNCALKWVHDLAGVPNPMGNTFLKSLIEGAKREHAKPVSKKAPVSSDALEECSLAHQSCETLLVRRDISMAVTVFGVSQVQRDRPTKNSGRDHF